MHSVEPGGRPKTPLPPLKTYPFHGGTTYPSRRYNETNQDLLDDRPSWSDQESFRQRDTNGHLQPDWYSGPAAQCNRLPV